MEKLSSCDIINEHFFFIDSNNLETVKSKIYGYYIKGNQIYDAKTASINDSTGGGGALTDVVDGSFVSIVKNASQIEIRTDYVGTHKLFLFRYEKYFALSNSFILLVDQIKGKFHLSLNEDYAYYMMGTRFICSNSLTETLLNEVELIPRNFKVIIDTKIKELNIERIDYKEYYIPLDNAEGLNVLDNWYERWFNIINGLNNANSHIQVDLSGGKDSRLTLATILSSGIDLNHVRFRSINDNIYIHPEDYEIASAISNFYGFKLNRMPFETKYKPFTLEEIMNVSFYPKLGFHKIMHFRTKGYALDTIYRFVGHGGEVMRSNWKWTVQRFMQMNVESGKKFRSFDLGKSIEKVLKKSIQQIDEMFDIYKQEWPIPMNRVHQETQNRQHFGALMVENYISNMICLSPALDYNLHKLKVPILSEGENDFFFILVFERYCKNLLDFKVQGKRYFDEKTREYARNINEKFPIKNKSMKLEKSETADKIYLNNTDIKEKAAVDGSNLEDIQKYLINLANTDKLKSIFASRFPLEIYMYSKRFAENMDYHPLSKFIFVIAVAKALLDIQISNQMLEKSSFKNIYSMIAPEVDITANDRSNLIKALIKTLLTARIELLADGETLQHIDCQSVSDGGEINEVKPKKAGYIFESDNQSLHIKLNCQCNAEVELRLQSKEVKGLKQLMIVDFTKVSIDDKNLLPDERVSVSRDKPLIVPLTFESGKAYELKFNWEVHGYSTDDFIMLATEFLNG